MIHEKSLTCITSFVFSKNYIINHILQNYFSKIYLHVFNGK